MSVTELYVACLMKKQTNHFFCIMVPRKAVLSMQKLRMKCSKLNFELFSLHVVDSPACPCGQNREDSNQYLLQCPLYIQGRNKMLNNIRQLSTFHISGDLLLYGAVELDYVTNCKI